MKRKILLVVIILFIAILGTILLALTNHPAEKQSQVCFRNYCFYVELSKTPEELSSGLMFRERLDDNRGMLFIFETEGDYPFWMKNTLIPLDIIWLNKNKEVVFISENAQPCKEDPCPSIEPHKDAKYVLEINGGLSQKLGFKIGDKINFNIDIR